MCITDWYCYVCEFGAGMFLVKYVFQLRSYKQNLTDSNTLICINRLLWISVIVVHCETVVH